MEMEEEEKKQIIFLIETLQKPLDNLVIPNFVQLWSTFPIGNIFLFVWAAVGDVEKPN